MLRFVPKHADLLSRRDPCTSEYRRLGLVSPTGHRQSADPGEIFNTPAFCLDAKILQSIPAGVRVMAGLFQAVAVRCGGFQIVSLSALAPAVQVLYVVMM